MTTQQSQGMVTVVFIEDTIRYDHEGVPVEAYTRGEKATLTEDRANKWLRRGRCRRLEDVPQVEPSNPAVATLDAVVDAIAKLDPEDESAWATNGMPKQKAIEDLLDGARCPAALRDMAWVKFRQQQT